MNLSEFLPFTVKIVICLVTVIVIFRLLGNKELAQATPLDLVYVVILADMIAATITDTHLTWYHGVFMCALWVGLIYVLEHFTRKSKFLNRLVQGAPHILIKKGVVIQETMKKLKITEAELEARLREKGVFHVKEVELAIIEMSGNLSVKKGETG